MGSIQVKSKRGAADMPWYMLALLICLIIGPFDALYVYIKSERRKDELRKRKEEQRAKENPPPSH